MSFQFNRLPKIGPLSSIFAMGLFGINIFIVNLDEAKSAKQSEVTPNNAVEEYIWKKVQWKSQGDFYKGNGVIITRKEGPNKEEFRLNYKPSSKTPEKGTWTVERRPDKLRRFKLIKSLPHDENTANDLTEELDPTFEVGASHQILALMKDQEKWVRDVNGGGRVLNLGITGKNCQVLKNCHLAFVKLNPKKLGVTRDSVPLSLESDKDIPFVFPAGTPTQGDLSEVQPKLYEAATKALDRVEDEVYGTDLAGKKHLDRGTIIGKYQRGLKNALSKHLMSGAEVQKKQLTKSWQDVDCNWNESITFGRNIQSRSGKSKNPFKSERTRKTAVFSSTSSQCKKDGKALNICFGKLTCKYPSSKGFAPFRNSAFVSCESSESCNKINARLCLTNILKTGDPKIESVTYFTVSDAFQKINDLSTNANKSKK